MLKILGLQGEFLLLFGGESGSRYSVLNQLFYLIFFNRHIGNGAIIARSSQPEVGLLYWRCAEDENLLRAFSEAISYDSPHAKENGFIKQVTYFLQMPYYNTSLDIIYLERNKDDH